MGTYLREGLGSGGSLVLLIGALAVWVGVPLGLASFTLSRRDL